MSAEWSINEQYNYGWFVPFFALYLFWLRWQSKEGDPRSEVGGPAFVRLRRGKQISEVGGRRIAFLLSTFALLLLFPIRLFEIGNPDWRPLGWIHAFAVAAFTFVVLWRIGGKTWVSHFAFPICFFFVAIPWVSFVENPVIQGLMHLIAGLTAETANLLGIPAQLEGNLIHIRNGLLGVNEACSGVRSLQTSLMIGLLFGELRHLSVAHRIILVAGAIIIALAANFCRALFLLYVAATSGMSATERWHDIAGYTIVALVFVGSLTLAANLAKGKSVLKLESRKAKVENAASDFRPQTSDLRPRFLISNFYFLLCALVWLLLVEISAYGWYRAHERDLVPRSDWTVRVSKTISGYREIKIDEGVRQTLRFDTGRELMWKTNGGTVTKFPTTNYLFFFRWNPSGSSVVRARAHRPDICLPSAGWRQLADLGTRTYSAGQDIAVPARHITFEQGGGKAMAHTFFCLQEDKIHPSEPRPDLKLNEGIQPDWSPKGRLRVVRNGVRNLGQQVLEIIIVSRQPIDDGAAEADFAKMIRELIVEGDQKSAVRSQ